jgi:hypothetical protein
MPSFNWRPDAGDDTRFGTAPDGRVIRHVSEAALAFLQTAPLTESHSDVALEREFEGRGAGRAAGVGSA